jgi:hypothetical protein
MSSCKALVPRTATKNPLKASGSSASPMMKCLSAARVLDIFWSKDKSLEDSASLSDPGLLALEIAEELEATRERFAAIAEDLKR